MKKSEYIFIGGKRLGYETLNFLLKKKAIPCCLVPNKDDIGKDSTFGKSVLKLARKKKIKIVKLENLHSFITKKKIAIDFFFCLGSTLILPKNVIDIPKIGALNIHPSILPKYRGRYSLPHAIFNNEKFAGLTIHWIGKGIDNGKIITQKKIKISNDDTAGTMYKKFTDLSVIEFKKVFKKIFSNKKKIFSRGAKKAKTKYVNKHFPNFGEINWKWEGKKIRNFIRSMIHEPFHPPEIKIGSKSFFIVSKEYLQKKKFLKSPL
jgi:methionyl-tRNA formyltransferase